MLAISQASSKPDSPANRDGCGCPPWVVACAHFGENMVWLCDNEIPPPRFLYQHLVYPGRFWVAGPGASKVCSYEEWRGQRVHLNIAVRSEDWFPDLESAQAAFDRRAAELIG